MGWLSRFLGLRPTYADPVVGEIWRSRNSGGKVVVASVDVGDTGYVAIRVETFHPKPRDGRPAPLADAYIFASGWSRSYAISEWNDRLYREDRIRVVK